MNKLLSKVIIALVFAFFCGSTAQAQVTWQFYSDPGNHCGISVSPSTSQYAIVCGGEAYLGAEMMRMSYNCYFSASYTEQVEHVRCNDMLANAYRGSQRNSPVFYTGYQSGNYYGDSYGGRNYRPATREPRYDLRDGNNRRRR